MQKNIPKFRVLRGEILEDRLVFSAAAAGIDIPYASAAELAESEPPFIAAPAPTSSSGEYNVGTYYDVKKYGDRTDSKLCWAATASGLLAYTNWGYAVSSSGETPDDRLFTSAEEIYDYFTGNFTNGSGSLISAIAWFAKGTTYSFSGWAQPTGDGGTLFPGISTSNICKTLYATSQKENLTAKMADYLEQGYGICVSVGWYTQDAPTTRSGGHALSVWGYTYDNAYAPTNPNYYTGLIITDSDNSLTGTQTIGIEWNEEYSMFHITTPRIAHGWIENFVCVTPIEVLTGIAASGYDGFYDGLEHTVTVSGIPSSSTDNYSVYYTYNSETSETAPSFTDAGNYSVRVVAVRNNCEAVWSAPVEINIALEGSGKLPAPAITAAKLTGNTSCQIAWTEIPGADTYELNWSFDEGQTWSRMFTSNTETTLNNLESGTTWVFRVRALGDEVNTFTGNWSAETVLETALETNPADIDADGFIGPGDYALISAAWFAMPGNENWDPRCDIDGDGFIGPGDFTFLSASWLKAS